MSIQYCYFTAYINTQEFENFIFNLLENLQEECIRQSYNLDQIIQINVTCCFAN